MNAFTPEQRKALQALEAALLENKIPTDNHKLRAKRREAVDAAYAECLRLCGYDALTKAEHAAVRKPEL